MYKFNKAYARKVAENFGLTLYAVQKQMIKFEELGIFVSFLEGKTRMFEWNPRYPFLEEIQALLKKAYQYIPEDEKAHFFIKRTRPRKTGKPL